MSHALLASSFWSSSASLVAVAAACALVVGAAVALSLSRRTKKSSIRERVTEFISAATTPEGEERAALLDASKGRLEHSFERERWWAEFKDSLEVARISRPPMEVVYLTIACSLAVALVLFVISKLLIIAILGLVVGPFLTRALVKRQLERQQNMFGDQLPAHLQELAASMRVGHSMVSGLGVVAEGATEPTRGEFQRVIADEQLGLPLHDALASVGERMHATDMNQVSLVAELHTQTGGNMAEVLDRVAEAVRDRAELNRELRTLTAQARGSRWIVTALPPVLLLVIDLINPSYLKPLLQTSTGHVLIVLAVLLMVGGSLVMGRIAKIEV